MWPTTPSAGARTPGTRSAHHQGIAVGGLHRTSSTAAARSNEQKRPGSHFTWIPRSCPSSPRRAPCPWQPREDAQVGASPPAAPQGRCDQGLGCDLLICVSPVSRGRRSAGPNAPSTPPCANQSRSGPSHTPRPTPLDLPGSLDRHNRPCGTGSVTPISRRGPRIEARRLHRPAALKHRGQPLRCTRMRPPSSPPVSQIKYCGERGAEGVRRASRNRPRRPSRTSTRSQQPPRLILRGLREVAPS